MKNLTKEELELLKNRILNKTIVNEDNSCWLWQGFVKINKEKNSEFPALIYQKKCYRVARILFLYFNETYDPDTVYLVNTCKTKNCINPQHKNLLTNMKDVGKIGGLKANKIFIYCKNEHLYKDAPVKYYPYRKKYYRQCPQCPSYERHSTNAKR